MLRLTHPGARAATRARPIPSLLLALFSIVACSDSASAPIAPRPPIAEADATPIVASTEPVAVPMSVLLTRLDEERRRGSESRLTIDATIDGAPVSLADPAAMHAALVPALTRATTQSSGNPAGPTTFGVPIYAGDWQLVSKGSLVTVASGRFDFSTFSIIDRSETAEFFHSGTQQVSLILAGVAQPLWSSTGTHVQRAPGGGGTTHWPSFTPSNGCHFAATLASQHRVLWPAGDYVPGFVSTTKSGTSGARNELRRSCTPPPPPPGPAPGSDSPICDDPSGAGCDDGGNGSGSRPYTGGSVEREMGRTGGLKTVCLVTDWYENGVYIETTIDRCWSEPIYR
jgi:hypothetical protein